MLLEQQLQKALLLQQQGNYKRAQTIYTEILDEHPNDAQTLHYLGLATYQLGDPEKAIAYITRAIAHAPDAYEFYNNLGAIYEAMNRLELARKYYRKAIKRHSDYPDALNNLASVLLKLGDIQEALEYYKKAIALQPGHVNAQCNLGVLYQQQGNFEQALSHYLAALQSDPSHLEALCNTADCYLKMGQIDPALAHYQRALKKAPSYTYLHNKIGNILRARGEFASAIQIYENALAIDQNHPWAHYNLAMVYKICGHKDKTKQHLTKCLHYDPQHGKALCQLGQYYEEQDNWNKASDYYHKAMLLDSNDSQALALHAHAQLHQAKWMNMDIHLARLKTLVETELKADKNIGISSFMAMHLLDDLSIQFAVAKSFARSTMMCITAPFAKKRWGHKKLRIGYISPDFRRHPVGLLLGDQFKHHNRDHFEIFGYDINCIQDDINQTIAQSCEHFVNLSQLSHRESAKLIHEDEIDVLVDLAGLTGNARPEILAHRPAPVQCHFLGDSGSMGADYIDYYITHPIEAPQKLESYFTEKFIYLPQTPIASTRLADIPCSKTRTELGLPTDAFVFCCFNNMARINEAVYDAWMKILSQVPEAILWLQTENKAVQNSLKEAALCRKVDPKRVVCTPLAYMTIEGHHQLADCYLDTFVLAGGTTSVIALGSGLPVLTRLGDTPQSRIGAAIVHGAGLDELICDSTRDYIDKAVMLATQGHAFAKLRKKIQDLHEHMPLFNPQAFIGHLEDAYQAAYQRFDHNQDPQHIVLG